LTIKAGLDIDPENEDLLALQKIVVDERDQDTKYTDEEESARISILTDWMKEHGSRFDKLKVRLYSSSLQGLHASRDIKKGDQILFIPNALVIASKKLKESEHG